MGEAAKQSGIARSDLFLTTKVLSAGRNAETTYKKCLASVEKISGKDGYVDLFLIHTPSGGTNARKEMWQALEKLESEGRAKSIGVSNFGVSHIEEMKSYARIWPPHINQFEVCQLLLLWSSNIASAHPRIATSLVSATYVGRLLSEAENCYRSLLPFGPESQGP